MTATQLLGVLLAVVVLAWRAVFVAWAWRGDRQRRAFWAFDLPLVFVVAVAIFLAAR